MPAKLWTRRSGTQQLYENFTVAGKRFRGCLDTTNPKQAQVLAGERKLIAEQGVRLARLREVGLAPAEQLPALGLHEALKLYYDAHGQHLPSAPSILGYSEKLETHFGKEKPMHEIGEGGIEAFCDFMRALNSRAGRPYSPRTINAHIAHLRHVASRLKRRYRMPDLDWGKLMLTAPEQLGDIIEGEDEVREILRHLSADAHPIFLFSLACGLRLDNAVNLTWEQVHWDAPIPYIAVIQKGGTEHPVAMSEAMLSILRPLRGQHATSVFTYVCDKSRICQTKGGGKVLRRKGERYPMTESALMKRWRRLRVAVNRPALNWHKIRASAATRLLQQSGDPGYVAAMTGHKNIETLLSHYTRHTRKLSTVKKLVDADAFMSRVAQERSAITGNDEPQNSVTQARHSPENRSRKGLLAAPEKP